MKKNVCFALFKIDNYCGNMILFVYRTYYYIFAMNETKMSATATRHVFKRQVIQLHFDCII